MRGILVFPEAELTAAIQAADEENARLKKLFEQQARQHEEAIKKERAKGHNRSRQILELADTDRLTRLPLRKGFERYLQVCLNDLPEQGEPDGSIENVAVLFFDYDWFKFLNDVYGHAFGDELLKIVGNALGSMSEFYATSGRLRSCRNPTKKRKPTAQRRGGDEFTLLLENVENEKQIVEVIETFRDIIKGCIDDLIKKEQFEEVGKPSWFSWKDAKKASVISAFSIGAVIVANRMSVSEALAMADAAMYASKAAGRNHATIRRIAAGGEQQEIHQALFDPELEPKIEALGLREQKRYP